MTFQSNYTRSAQQIIVDLLNADNSNNGVTITPAQVSFGVPVPNNTQGAAYNTSLTLSGSANSGISGNINITYNRVALSVVPGNLSTTIPVLGFSKISDTLPTVNAAYGINLAPADIVDGALPAFSDPVPLQYQTITLKASGTSLVFNGSVDLVAYKLLSGYQQVATKSGKAVVRADGRFVVARSPRTNP